MPMIDPLPPLAKSFSKADMVSDNKDKSDTVTGSGRVLEPGRMVAFAIPVPIGVPLYVTVTDIFDMVTEFGAAFCTSIVILIVAVSPEELNPIF